MDSSTNLVAAGVGLTAAAIAYVYLTSKPERREKTGPAATEGLLNPGDKDYDKKMAELWGG